MDTPSTRWAIAEASAVKKRVSKRRTAAGRGDSARDQEQPGRVGQEAGLGKRLPWSLERGRRARSRFVQDRGRFPRRPRGLPRDRERARAREGVICGSGPAGMEMVDGGGIVHELGDFFFERHAGDQVVDARFRRGRRVFIGLGEGWDAKEEADCQAAAGCQPAPQAHGCSGFPCSLGRRVRGRRVFLRCGFRRLCARRCL